MPTRSNIWNPDYRLLLASKSKSRRELLTRIGIPFEAVAAEISERAVESAFLEVGGLCERLPAALAQAKALEVSRRYPSFLCLGADQVLSLDGQLFHKARTIGEAHSHLARLTGRTHQLTSAFAIAKGGVIAHEACDTAQMTMRKLDADQITLYLRTAGAEVLQSVGAYQVENIGIHLFERIEGDHSTILGLPILKVLSWLRGYGALIL